MTPYRQAIPPVPSILNHCSKQEGQRERLFRPEERAAKVSLAQHLQLPHSQQQQQQQQQPQVVLSMPQIEAHSRAVAVASESRQHQYRQETPPHTPNPLAYSQISTPLGEMEPSLPPRFFTDDDQTNVSPLQCGSIQPNPHYNPALDPCNKPCIPPTEIVVPVKTEVPEWLKPTFRNNSIPTPANLSVRDRGHSAPTTNERGPSHPIQLRRQVSWDSRMAARSPLHVPQDIRHGIPKHHHQQQQQQKYDHHHHHHNTPVRKFADTLESSGTFRTIPMTFSSSDDDESAFLPVLPERKPLQGRGGLMGKLPSFRRRLGSADLQPSRGCLI